MRGLNHVMCASRRQQKGTKTAKGSQPGMREKTKRLLLFVPPSPPAPAPAAVAASASPVMTVTVISSSAPVLPAVVVVRLFRLSGANLDRRKKKKETRTQDSTVSLLHRLFGVIRQGVGYKEGPTAGQQHLYRLLYNRGGVGQAKKTIFQPELY